MAWKATFLSRLSPADTSVVRRAGDMGGTEGEGAGRLPVPTSPWVQPRLDAPSWVGRLLPPGPHRARQAPARTWWSALLHLRSALACPPPRRPHRLFFGPTLHNTLNTLSVTSHPSPTCPQGSYQDRDPVLPFSCRKTMKCPNYILFN